MDTKKLSGKISKLLIGFLSLSIMSAIGCSSSAINPIAGELEETITAGETVSSVEIIEEEVSVREAQFNWDDFDEGLTEPNDTPDQTYQINTFDFNPFFQGHVDAELDQNDYFKIWVNGTIYAKLGWTGDAWLNIYLYDESMQPVEYLNANTGGPKEIFFDGNHLSVGYYYLRIKAIDGAANYGLKILTTTWNFMEPENNSIYSAQFYQWTHIEYWGGVVKSIVGSEDDPNDYWLVEVPESGYRLNISLDWAGEEDTNLNVYLYDEDYNPIAYSNGTAQPEAFGSGWMAAGTYYIRVLAVTGNAIYELSVEKEEPYSVPPWLYEKYVVEEFYPSEPDPEPWHDWEIPDDLDILKMFDPDFGN